MGKLVGIGSLCSPTRGGLSCKRAGTCLGGPRGGPTGRSGTGGGKRPLVHAAVPERRRRDLAGSVAGNRVDRSTRVRGHDTCRHENPRHRQATVGCGSGSCQPGRRRRAIDRRRDFHRHAWHGRRFRQPVDAGQRISFGDGRRRRRRDQRRKRRGLAAGRARFVGYVGRGGEAATQNWSAPTGFTNASGKSPWRNVSYTWTR